MHITTITAILLMVLLPIPAAFSAELYDTEPTLAVYLSDNQQFVYRDDQGYTVVIGQVTNNDSRTSVANVLLSVNFYDDAGSVPLEFNAGGTVLEVIPPLGSSPYMIKSKSPNPAIKEVSVNIEGFDSSSSKLKQGTVVVNHENYRNGVLSFSGALNNGQSPVSDANVHVVFYDGFVPPRIVGIHTVELGDVYPDTSADFEFSQKISQHVVEFAVFFESDAFYSDFLHVDVPPPEELKKLATITDVTIKDTDGNKLSDIPAGSTVIIESTSWVQFADFASYGPTPYTYFVQIKQVGSIPYVIFLAQLDGVYVDASDHLHSVEWTPQAPGEFFVETFVWDGNNVPIAKKGPFTLVSVK